MGFQIKRVEEKDATVYELKGVIDELADFGPIQNGPKVTVLDFDGIERVNSYGVKKWLRTVKDLAARGPVRYRRCPTALVEQINMVSALYEAATIESFYMPFRCQCQEDEIHKLVKTAEATAPGFIEGLSAKYPCDRCDRKLEFADDESIYFEFLEA